MDKTQKDKIANEVKVEDVYLHRSEKLTPGRKWSEAIGLGGMAGAVSLLIGSFFSDFKSDKLVKAIEENQTQSQLKKLAEKMQNTRFWVAAVSFGAALGVGSVTWFASKREEDNAMRVAKQALEEKKRLFLAEHPELEAAPMPVVVENPDTTAPTKGSENEPSMKVHVSAGTLVSAGDLAPSPEMAKA